MKTLLAILFGFSLTAAAQFPHVSAAFLWQVTNAPAGGGGYAAAAVLFDGGSDTMGVTNAHTGLANGYGFTFSVWIKPLATGSEQVLFSIYDISTIRFRISRLDDGRLFARASSAGAVLKLSTSTVEALPQDSWTHLLMAIDRATPLTNVWFNGVAMAVTNATWVGNDGNPNAYQPTSGNARYRVGGNYDASNKFHGAMAEFWWDDNTFGATPAAFAAAGKPISLGADGSGPSGTSPVFYFKDPINDFGINYGTGEDFIVSGSFDAATPP